MPLIRVIIYQSPTEWFIKDISKNHIDIIRQKLIESGYYFVFTETCEDT